MKRGFSLWMALVLAIMTILPGYAEESVLEAPVELATDAGDTGLNLSAVKRIIVRLKSKGLLENTGTNRNSIWKVSSSYRRE